MKTIITINNPTSLNDVLATAATKLGLGRHNVMKLTKAHWCFGNAGAVLIVSTTTFHKGEGWHEAMEGLTFLNKQFRNGLYGETQFSWTARMLHTSGKPQL